MPSSVRTSSKPATNLASRSRIRNVYVALWLSASW
jgi:hypothetical protein